MPLLITLRLRPGRLLLSLEGELDLLSAPALREHLAALFEERSEPHLDLDLSRVPFLDCAGARELAWALDRVKERGGGMTVLHPRPIALHLLRLLGLDTELTIVGGVPYRREENQG